MVNTPIILKSFNNQKHELQYAPSFVRQSTSPTISSVFRTTRDIFFTFLLSYLNFMKRNTNCKNPTYVACQKCPLGRRVCGTFPCRPGCGLRGTSRTSRTWCCGWCSTTHQTAATTALACPQHLRPTDWHGTPVS